MVEEGLDAQAAVQRAGFIVLLPQEGRPTGYQAVAGQAFRGTGRKGVAVAFRRPAAELDGVGLLLYEALGQPMPPPTRGDVQAVEVRGVMGRWSPGEHELEWIEGGVYVSLSGPSFGLTELLEVADAMVADRSGT